MDDDFRNHFIATNLRAPLTSVRPLVGHIRDQLQLSNALAGMITTLPLLAFAFISPFVPRLGRKFGIEFMVLCAIIFLTFGILIRSTSGTANLYIGTAMLGLAISVCNVLLPSLIKREFPRKIGVMTGVYSISMNLFGAIASGISIPIMMKSGYGWQGALGIWGILSFLSIFFWMPQMKKQHHLKAADTYIKPTQAKVNLWRSPLALASNFIHGTPIIGILCPNCLVT
ncbi:MFS transporter [Carnobacterium mobile]|uniref:MFS transporter n=1 Tax=Carnobacterium mobile TaxID=2750 RepID=UPI000A9D590E|nr:MFS transporter [Carnobacterium mobile]